MKFGIKTWMLLIYGLLLLASFMYRNADRTRSEIPTGWQSMELAVVDSDKQVEDQRITMVFRDIGNSNGPTLLLLHGSPMASGCFDKLVPHLEKEFRLILPDLPGFGHSRNRHLPDYSIEGHAQYLDSFLIEKDLENVHVVAYSLGGGAALHLAELAPQRIDDLVMLSSIGVQEQELLGDYLLNHVIHGLQLSVVAAVQELTPHFGLMDRWMINRSYARNFFDTDQRPLRKILNRWEKPMIIVHGDQDKLVPPSAAQEHHRIVPQSSLHWIKNGSHIALMSRAEEVADLIRTAVLTKNAPTRATAPAERLAAAKVPYKPVKLDKSIGQRVGVMALLAVATLGSEDLACISGGLLASRHVISLATTIVGCFIGIFFGDLALFLLGRWCGLGMQKIPFLSNQIDGARVDAGREWVEAHAAKLIVASRFLPGSRLPTYVSMGATGMPLGKFTVWFFLAVSIWTPLLVGVSMFFGDTLLPFFEKHERYFFPGLAGIMVLGFLLVRVASSIATWKGRRLFVSRWRRIVSWEFWPAWLIYSLLIPTFIRLSFRHRSFTVFTAANPAIPCGGLAVEPKLISLEALQSSGNVPAFRSVASIEALDEFMAGENINYPIVLKPDVGERGRGVAIVESRNEATVYFSDVPDDVVIVAQDYVEGDEFGVFYYRLPSEEKGKILAITEKKDLSITGDGERSVEELILADDRAVCMASYFLKEHNLHRWDVLEVGEKMMLGTLGTHARGALFMDGERFHTEKLEEEMDRISQHFPEFYFGRYDVKVPSAESLAKGEEIMILELNGVTSEATMIYDPKNSLRKGLAILRNQWGLAYSIGAANRERGVEPATLSEVFKNLREYRNQNKFEAPTV